jgi:hypothetical protein
MLTPRCPPCHPRESILSKDSGEELLGRLTRSMRMNYGKLKLSVKERGCLLRRGEIEEAR